MLLRMGPFVPEDLKVVILFHFGPEEGHTCDLAEFDWYINGKFHAFLNFNNGSTGEEVQQGPFNMDLAEYIERICASRLSFLLCARVATVLIAMRVPPSTLPGVRGM